MKLRKRSAEDILEQEKDGSSTFSPPASPSKPFFSSPSYHSLNSALSSGVNVKPALGQSLVHLPLQLAQNSFIMNNIPAGYNPVLSSMRYLPNDSFNSLNQSQSQAQQQQQQQQQINQLTRDSADSNNNNNNSSNSIDWSKHAYTPLEITGHYSNPSSILPNASMPDWRDQIYYWQGKMEYDESLQCVTWKGKWIGSFTGKPTQEEFSSSESAFYYTSVPIDKAKIFPNGNTTALRPISGFYRGYYLMEREEPDVEPEKYSDKEFLLDFEDGGKTNQYYVYGKGDSEFGVFLLQGTYDATSRNMELCRQYITENDLRSSMQLAQLKLNLKRNPLGGSSAIIF
jgi:hypothetical protein